MLFFSVGAIYFFKRWTENPSSILYLSTLSCTALAVLVKLPAAIIGLPMAYAAHRAFGWRFLRRPEVWLLAVLSFVPAVLWYRHAFALALSNYPFHMFGQGLWVWDDPTHLLRWEGYARGGAKAALFLVTPLGFLFALAGLREQIGERAGIFAWWAVALLVYVIAGLEGIRNHEYYLLPLLPVVAAYAGVGADQLLVSSRRLVGAVALVAIPSLLLLATRYESALDRMLYEAGRTARSVLPDDALVAAWDWGSPVLLYASGLHGWHFPHHARLAMGLFGEEDVPRHEWMPVLEELRDLGATHLVAPKPPETERMGLLGRPTSVQGMDSIFSADLDRRFFVSYEDERAVIYNLQRSRNDPGN